MDKQLLQEYYQRVTDQEIINIITNDGKTLTPEAIEIIELEVKKRQLNPEILQFLVPEENNEIPVPTIFTAEGCPVDEPVRIWLEAAFQKLLNMFGEENTQTRSVLIPERIHFPVKFDGSEKSAIDTLKIVAAQMEVSNEKISLDFYDDHYRKITPNSPAGLYHGKNEDGIFEISIVRSLLDTPEELIAVLAHEIAHIKLLGENRLEENDEPLTDLTTVFFGLGVFNANAAFQTFADAKYYGWSRAGYLTQIEWGYALALFAAIRDEENPVWVDYLNKSVGAYFKRGLDFIANNSEMIFQEIEE